MQSADVEQLAFLSFHSVITDSSAQMQFNHLTFYLY